MRSGKLMSKNKISEKPTVEDTYLEVLCGALMRWPAPKVIVNMRSCLGGIDVHAAFEANPSSSGYVGRKDQPMLLCYGFSSRVFRFARSGTNDGQGSPKLYKHDPHFPSGRHQLTLWDNSHLLCRPLESAKLGYVALRRTMGDIMSSYLGIEGYHAFVTGARGGIGSSVVRELTGMPHPK
jgi:hypothetical protein